MPTRLPLDAILACMSDYAQAVANEREAASEYDGYSWDYHGASYIEAIREAESEAEKVIDDYIKLCVTADIDDERKALYRLVAKDCKLGEGHTNAQRELIFKARLWCEQNPEK